MLTSERLISRMAGHVRLAAAKLTTSLAAAPLRIVGRVVSTPFRALAEGFRTAFAPVRAEGDRQRGAALFHGAPPAAEARCAPAMPPMDAHAIITAALADVPEKGDPTLPEDLSALAVLLAETPQLDDFGASDLIRDCFAAFGASGVQSRALLAVALNLSRHFGQPTHYPLACDRAWRMLDPVIFEDEMAEQLTAISEFISDWQKTQKTFLCLDFAEIDLIEWLFECLHPHRHSDLMFEVMNFKVLSNRRQGILRRIPHRVRKAVKDLGGGPEAVLFTAGTRAYLDRLVTKHGFTPIVETATVCLEEVNKVLEKLAPPPALPSAGPGEPQALARITPVKMPASELADRAMAPVPQPGQPPAAAAPPSMPPRPPGLPAAPPVAPQPLATQPLPPRPQAPPAAAANPFTPPQPAARPPGAPPAATPQTLPAAPSASKDGVRPATIRLQPKHIRAGAELTIPSRSAGRIPLGRVVSTGSTPEAAVQAITVGSQRERPMGRPSRLPAPIDAVIPASLPHLALPSPAAAPAALPPPKPVTGRVNLALPGRAVQAPPPPPNAVHPSPAMAAATAPAAPPAAAAAVATAAPVMAEAPSSGNVTKLTVVPKRRLPITQALKRQSVMRVLRGEDAEAVAQAIGISRTKLDDWVDKFVAAGAGALSSGGKQRKSEELTVDTLRAKLAEVLATAQLIEQVMESSLPRRPILLPPPQDSVEQPRPRRKRKKQV